MYLISPVPEVVRVVKVTLPVNVGWVTEPAGVYVAGAPEVTLSVVTVPLLPANVPFTLPTAEVTTVFFSLVGNVPTPVIWEIVDVLNVTSTVLLNVTVPAGVMAPMVILPTVE